MQETLTNKKGISDYFAVALCKKGGSGVGFTDRKRSNHFAYFTILSP